MKAYDVAYEMFLDGKTNQEIKEATGIGYSPMWLDRTRRQIAEGRISGGFIKTHDDLGMELSATAVAAQIARYRADNESWGLIAVRANMPEGRARRIFAKATGIDSRGLRIGKGGRWVANEPAFYTGGDRGKLGTELDPHAPVLTQVPAGDEEVAERHLTERAVALEAELSKLVKKATTPKAPRKSKASKSKASK